MLLVMRLSDESIEEFRTLYEQEFGETISTEDAGVRAREMVTFYQKLYEAVERNAVSLEGEEGLPETSA